MICRSIPYEDIKNTVQKAITQNLNLDEIKRDLQHTFITKLTSVEDSIALTMDTILEQKLSNMQPNQVGGTQTYAQVLNSRHSRIVIRPKDNSQDTSRTKNDILSHINPAEENIQLSKVKHIADGGILLTTDPSSVDRVMNLANEKLAGEYDVRELKAALPVVRIVGLSEEYSKDALQHHIKSQNKNIFTNCSDFSVLKIWPTKKNNVIWQANLQLDIVTYNRLKEHNRIVVGLDNCNIYDSTSITRCFKCNNFGHSIKFCKKDIVSCPLCAEHHDVKECSVQAGSYKCSNCSFLKTKYNLNIDTNHAVWNNSACYAFKQANKSYKAEIFGSTQ